MPLGGIIAGVGALAGGLIGANASSSAARSSATASRRASDAQMEMYRQTRADLAPQREAQRSALDALLSMTGLPALSGNYNERAGRDEVPRGVVEPRFSLASILNRSGSAGYGSRVSGYGAARVSPTSLSNLGTMNDSPVWDHNAAWDMYAPSASMVPPVARAFGGPIQAGERYTLSELGHPEGIYDSSGTLQNISTQPQTITAQQDGYVRPMVNGPGDLVSSAIHTINNPPQTAPALEPTPGIPANYQQSGIPIPGSTTLENPGGQPGRYNFMTDPGYSFRFGEGQRAIERSASARGGVLSGGILRELARYGQGLGSAEYGNVFGRLSTIAGMGQTGQSLTAQAGQNTANQQGGYLQNIGNAAGAGAIGRASAYGDTLSQLARLYGQYNPPNQTYPNQTYYGHSAGGSITP